MADNRSTIISICGDSLHRLLAELIRAGVAAPDEPLCVGATAEQIGITISMHIVAYRGPARLVLRPGVVLDGMIGIEGGAAVPVAEAPHVLREVERAILESAPGPNEPGVKVQTLAKRTKKADGTPYRYSSYFRQAVARLQDMGLLTSGRCGVRRTR